MWFDKVIAKIKRVRFLPHTVERGYGKSRLASNISLYMEAIQDMTIITMEGESELVCDQSNGVASNARTIRNPDFKGTAIIRRTISQKNIYKIRDHVFGDKLNYVTTQIGAGAATGVAISEAEI